MAARFDIGEPDAIVIGSGPNGLAAAITLAEAGCRVSVVEASSIIGGGARTAELTLPGFHHDICSAVHPLGFASPVFRRLPLAQYGLEWIHPPAPLAHPFDDGSAVLLERSIEETAAALGDDGAAYERFFRPLTNWWGQALDHLLNFPALLRHPLNGLRFGYHSLRSGRSFAEKKFSGEKARTLFAGLAGHSMLPLEKRPSAGVGLALALMAHSGGWPIARGGSQSLEQCTCRSPAVARRKDF